MGSRKSGTNKVSEKIIFYFDRSPFDRNDQGMRGTLKNQLQQ